MLFERRQREGLLDGTIRVAFRHWRRPQVVAGHRYRIGAGAGVIPVERVDVVAYEQITESDAEPVHAVHARRGAHRSADDEQ